MTSIRVIDWGRCCMEDAEENAEEDADEDGTRMGARTRTSWCYLWTGSQRLLHTPYCNLWLQYSRPEIPLEIPHVISVNTAAQRTPLPIHDLYATRINLLRKEELTNSISPISTSCSFWSRLFWTDKLSHITFLFELPSTSPLTRNSCLQNSDLSDRNGLSAQQQFNLWCGIYLPFLRRRSFENDELDVGCWEYGSGSLIDQMHRERITRTHQFCRRAPESERKTGELSAQSLSSGVRARQQRPIPRVIHSSALWNVPLIHAEILERGVKRLILEGATARSAEGRAWRAN